MRYRVIAPTRFVKTDKTLPFSVLNERIEESYRKIGLAKKYLWIWKMMPWVKMVLITGSTASLNAQKEDDIDFWIITEPKRIWLSRFIEGIILFFLKRRRMRYSKDVKDSFCINFYMTTEALQLDRENSSFAMQFVDAIPLIIKDYGQYKVLLESNEWISKFFPSWYQFQSEQLYKGYAAKTYPPTKRSFFSTIVDYADLLLGLGQLTVAKRKFTSSVFTEVNAKQYMTWADRTKR